jgi:hypothetical protein
MQPLLEPLVTNGALWIKTAGFCQSHQIGVAGNDTNFVCNHEVIALQLCQRNRIDVTEKNKQSKPANPNLADELSAWH